MFKFNDDMIKLMKNNEKANITGNICLKIYERMFLINMDINIDKKCCPILDIDGLTSSGKQFDLDINEVWDITFDDINQIKIILKQYK